MIKGQGSRTASVFTFDDHYLIMSCAAVFGPGFLSLIGSAITDEQTMLHHCVTLKELLTAISAELSFQAPYGTCGDVLEREHVLAGAKLYPQPHACSDSSLFTASIIIQRSSVVLTQILNGDTKKNKARQTTVKSVTMDMLLAFNLSPAACVKA